jgi:hypothetical protein
MVEEDMEEKRASERASEPQTDTCDAGRFEAAA